MTDDGRRATPDVRPRWQLGRWLPIGAMMLLILALGGYTTNRDSNFLTTFNLSGVMVATMPVISVPMKPCTACPIGVFAARLSAT